jgi:nicotinamidase-related amidase
MPVTLEKYDTDEKKIKVMKNAAFITTDLQYDLIQKSPERISRVNEMMPSMLKFIHALRDNNVPIIHQQLVYKEDDNVEIMNGKIPCLEGSEGSKIISDIEAEKDIIMKKRKDSGFYETALDDVLKEMDIDTVFLGGMQAQICIQTTGADAYFRGYNVIAVSDCITSTLEKDKRRALDWISGYCGIVKSSDEILEAIETKSVIEFPVIYTP